MSKYETVVGNIGTVYSGKNKKNAIKAFNHYVKDSKSGLGRAGNQQVCIIETNPKTGVSDVIREFDPE